MPSLKRVASLVGRNLFVLFILLFILEVVLHFFLINTENEQMLDFASLNQLEKRGVNPIFTSHRYLGYITSPNYQKDKNRHNSLGFRGNEIVIPKKKDTYRIFCLGGSTTYTNHVQDFKKAYPYLLEKNLLENGLDVEVINAGVNSWTTHESLINFQLRILDLEPDMIIIYHSINDVKNRMVFPFDKYVSDNSGRRAALIDYEKNWKEWLIEKSNILRIICIRAKLVRSNRSILTIDPMKDSYVGSEFARQVSDKTYPSGIFKKHTMEEIFNKNVPQYYKQNIELMIGIAKLNDIDVMLSTFAYSAADKRKSKKKPKTKLTNQKEIVDALNEQNNIIKQIANEQGMVFLDFDKKFSNKKNLFNDGVHVNERGSEIKAKIFSDFLMTHFFNKTNTTLN